MQVEEHVKDAADLAPGGGTLHMNAGSECVCPPRPFLFAHLPVTRAVTEFSKQSLILRH